MILRFFKSTWLLRLGGVALAAFLIFYAAQGVYLGWNQTALIFHPQAEWVETPADHGLSYEDVRFTAEDGVELSGWFVPIAEPKAPVVLVVHGNAGNISHRLPEILFFHRLGYSVFIFDYRGFGKSGGKLSEAGTYRDAEAAYRYLMEKKGFPPHCIVIAGRSLGAAIAVRLAASRSPRALLLESGFTSLGDLAAELYPRYPVRWFLRYRYKTLEEAKKVACPVLVVHSREDTVVPFSHGERLYRAVRSPKYFLEIKGPHSQGYIQSEEIYREALGSFLPDTDCPVVL